MKSAYYQIPVLFVVPLSSIQLISVKHYLFNMRHYQFLAIHLSYSTCLFSIPESSHFCWSFVSSDAIFHCLASELFTHLLHYLGRLSISLSPVTQEKGQSLSSRGKASPLLKSEEDKNELKNTLSSLVP